MNHPSHPTTDQLEVIELEGQAAEDLLVSDFGALSLEPTTEADFFAKLRRLFGPSNGSAA